MNKTTVDALKDVYVELGGNIADVKDMQTDAEVIEALKALVGSTIELPPVTSEDNGDVLKVVDGEWAKATQESGLPSVTSEDNGDVLTVVEGAWAKAAPAYIDDWVYCSIKYKDNTTIEGNLVAQYSPSRNIMSMSGYIKTGGKSGEGIDDTLCKIIIPNDVDLSNVTSIGNGKAVSICSDSGNYIDAYYGAMVKSKGLNDRILSIDVHWKPQVQQLEYADFFIGSFVY